MSQEILTNFQAVDVGKKLPVITPEVNKIITGLMEVIHMARRKENNRKNHKFASELRDMCKKVGVLIKDNKDGTSDWKLI